MTDSESDTSNVFTFENNNLTVSAKGPNTKSVSYSFRKPMTSTMCMPRNFEQYRYAESAYDQRSMYYRRETSPMSIRSACDIQPRNFQPYRFGMSSQQSVCNGRSGSPMSMRSIDSTASVSAAELAFAFKNVKCNNYEFKIIKEAYQNFLREHGRKRFKKRRNRRLFLKGYRRRSGDDSGEQGSNSSVSSDDCRSQKTSYKENMSSSQSARMDLTNFRRTVRDHMLKDCSDNFRQNTFKNKFAIGSSSVSNSHSLNGTLISKPFNQKERFQHRNVFLPPSQRFNGSVASSATLESNSHSLNGTIMSKPFNQKERFLNRNVFLPPSQRFNKSVASSVILEKPNKNIENNVNNHHAQNKQNINNHPPSEEEIFSEMTVGEKNTFNIELLRKRSFDSEDESGLPEKKKSRISSIKNVPKNNKTPHEATSAIGSNNNIEMANNFEFAKPTLPVRKSKAKVQEKLIAKSAQPLTDFLEPIPNKVQDNVQILQPVDLQEKSSENLTQLDQSETTQNSDVSARPSFIKRKLFTQKLDVAEKANLSNDGINSPQPSVYSQKEKNKARKLVTNQSCLNRDVQDDNNLLDLIHKIVPPDRMNVTNQTTINQTKNDVYNKNKKDNDDKWDVTSVLSMCNEDDVSDTYTDEEIFQADNTKIDNNKKSKDINHKDQKNNVIVKNISPIRDCRIMVEKLQNNTQKQNTTQNCNNGAVNNNVKSFAKAFWDTDLETDDECLMVLPRNQVLDNLKKAKATLDTANQNSRPATDCSKKSSQIPEETNQFNITMNNTVTNNTVDNTHRFITSTLSVRSHRTSKKKKCFNETCLSQVISKLDKQNKISRNNNKENAKDTSKKPIDNINTKANLKSNLNTDNGKHTVTDKARSTSQIKKSQSANNKPKIKLEAQKNCSAIKAKVENLSKNTKLNNSISNTQSDSKKNKKGSQKSPKNKAKSKADQQNTSTPSKKNNPVSHTTVETKQNNSVISNRPIRSCRTPKQNTSTELSRSSQLNNTSIDGDRILRSRVINLSSSIENITIKPRNKTNNNKNVMQINTRRSNVSFSLGSGAETPTPKKKNSRGKPDFFKGKRKT